VPYMWRSLKDSPNTQDELKEIIKHTASATCRQEPDTFFLNCLPSASIPDS